MSIFQDKPFYLIKGEKNNLWIYQKEWMFLSLKKKKAIKLRDLSGSLEKW